MKKKSALVLGGGGFIGGHLAKRLKTEGFLSGLAISKPLMNIGLKLTSATNFSLGI